MTKLKIWSNLTHCTFKDKWNTSQTQQYLFWKAKLKNLCGVRKVRCLSLKQKEIRNKKEMKNIISPRSLAPAAVSCGRASSSPSSSSSAAGCWTGRPPSPASVCRFYPSDRTEEEETLFEKRLILYLIPL